MSLTPLDIERSDSRAPARRELAPGLTGLAAFLLVLSSAAVLDSVDYQVAQETQKIGLITVTLLVVLASRFAVPSSWLEPDARARRERLRRGAIGGAGLGILLVAGIAAINAVGG